MNTEDVQRTVTDYLDTVLVNAFGHGLPNLQWDGNDDDPFGPLVVKDRADGNRYEIEFDVFVTRLDETEMARRDAMRRRAARLRQGMTP